MGVVKFIKSKNKLGSLQESKTTPDAIYFPTDSTSIIMGGKEYGGQPLTEEQLQAVNSGVTEEWVADVDGQLSGLTSGNKRSNLYVGDISASNVTATTVTATTFVGTHSGRSTRLGFGDDINLIASYGNEINFGGNWSNSTNTNICFGYRSIDNRPVPTRYKFFSGAPKLAEVEAAKFIGTASSAGELNNLYTSRQASANLPVKGDGKVRYFVATSSMTEGKPTIGDSHILHMAWDLTNGYDVELAVSHDYKGIQYRSQNGGEWKDWATCLDEKNYNTYVPKLDGTGATGSWNIAAASAGGLNNLYTSRQASANLPVKGDGKVRYFVATSSMKEGKPTIGDSHILHMAWDLTNGHDVELAVSHDYKGIQYRSQNGGEWKDWATCLDEKNYNTYVPKLDGTGATGSWNIAAAKATADEDGNSIKGSYAKKSEINNLDDRLISTVDDAGTYRTRLRGNIDIIETDEILGEIYPPTMTITDDPFEAKADSNIIVATPTEISLKTYSDYGYSSGEDPANETTISSTAISTKEIKADKITKGGRSVLTTNDILGQLGQDDTRVMSQKAVTNALADVQSTFESITVDYDSAREVYSVLNEQEVIDVMSTNKPFNVHVVTDGNPDVYDTYLASAPSVEDMGNTLKTTAFMADISILGFRFLKIECNVMDISVSFEGAFGSLSV